MVTQYFRKITFQHISLSFFCIFIGAIIAVINNQKFYNLNLGYMALMLAILFPILVFCFIYIGINETLILGLLATLSFNIELPIYSVGENGFNDSHPGGLRAALVINHIYIILLIWFITHIKVFLYSNSVGNIKTFSVGKWYLLFFLSGFLSFLLAGSKLAASYPLIRIAFVYVLYKMVVNIELKKIWNYFINCSIFIVFFQFLIGIIQIITGNNVGLRILGESSEPFRATSLVSIEERGMSGTLGHPGIMGLFFILIMPILLSQYINSPPRSKIRKMSLLFSIIITFILVVLTNARTSIVILLFSSLLIIFGSLYIKGKANFSLKKVFSILISSMIFLIFIIIIRFDSFYERFADSDLIYQIYYRTNLSLMSLDITFNNLKNFLFGVGLNNYTDIITKMGEGFAYNQPVHNFYLLLWVEGGVFHFISYICILLTVIVNMFVLITKSNYDLSYKSLTILICMISLLIYNFTGWSAYHNQIFITSSILCSLSIKIQNEYINKN